MGYEYASLRRCIKQCEAGDFWRCLPSSNKNWLLIFDLSGLSIPHVQYRRSCIKSRSNGAHYPLDWLRTPTRDTFASFRRFAASGSLLCVTRLAKSASIARIKRSEIQGRPRSRHPAFRSAPCGLQVLSNFAAFPSFLALPRSSASASYRRSCDRKRVRRHQVTFTNLPILAPPSCFYGFGAAPRAHCQVRDSVRTLKSQFRFHFQDPDERKSPD